jgi:hypothetical protein
MLLSTNCFLLNYYKLCQYQQNAVQEAKLAAADHTKL